MHERLHRLMLRRSLEETLWLGALIVVFSMLGGVFTFRTAVVDGVSMEPTIHDGERLIINIHAYDRVGPARGDIIVFDYPQDPRREFIKRVIGLPGETVQIDHGVVEVNGQPLTEAYHPITEAQVFGPVVVPPSTLFVLGDNRPHSSDSRIWGPLATYHIHGRAQYVVLPLADMAVLR